MRESPDVDNCHPLREANAKRFFIFYVLPNALQKIPGMHFPDRMSGDDLQPLHQRLVLFRCDLQCFFLCTGPAETAKLQPFVKQKESISFLSEYSDKKAMVSAFYTNGTKASASNGRGLARKQNRYQNSSSAGFWRV